MVVVKQMEINYTASQLEAIYSENTNLLVTAGAGSGKTLVLTERVLEIAKKLKHGEKVLALTFTNKAADELNERISNLEANIEDKVFVGTIHKFCLDIVINRGFMIGLPRELHIIDNYEDRIKLFELVLKDNPSISKKYTSFSLKDSRKKIKNLFDSISLAKRNLKFHNDIDDIELRTLYKDYDEILLNQAFIDYDDIVRYTYQIFLQKDNVRKLYQNIYKCICIDESQDLNKAQYEIIKTLADNVIPITMVGDPNQSIYSFNGSSSEYMSKNFVKDYNPKILSLLDNFRSAKSIINAAKIIEPSFNIEGNVGFEGEFTINKLHDEKEEASWIINKILDIVEHRKNDIEKINFNDVAVIARNKYIFNPLIELLNTNDIEFSIRASNTSGLFAESDFISTILLGWRLIINNKDLIHLSSLREYVKGNYRSFEELMDLNKIDDPWYWNDCKKILMNIESQKDNLNLNPLFDVLDSITESIKDEFERYMVENDLELLKAYWTRYLSNSQAGTRTLANFINAIAIGTVYNNERGGVVLTTVHMAKGKEFKAVFIMGLNDGIFPDYRSIDSKEKLIEERHNLFVAITRAKRICHLTYPIYRKMAWGSRIQSKSRFLSDF
jgi:DNA helicase-2/ATP-dependent DNA helicase PcrA